MFYFHGSVLEWTPHSQRHVYIYVYDVDEWIHIDLRLSALVRIVNQGPCKCSVSWLVRGHRILYFQQSLDGGKRSKSGWGISLGVGFS